MRDGEKLLNAHGYFLRDDRPIREGSPHFRGIEEAYSLHTRSPFERLLVLGGPKSWAVAEALKFVNLAPVVAFGLDNRPASGRIEV